MFRINSTNVEIKFNSTNVEMLKYLKSEFFFLILTHIKGVSGWIQCSVLFCNYLC